MSTKDIIKVSGQVSEYEGSEYLVGLREAVEEGSRRFWSKPHRQNSVYHPKNIAKDLKLPNSKSKYCRELDL